MTPGAWTTLHYAAAAQGGSHVLIRHLACGGTTRVYLWSFAGHGKKRCSACSTWLHYGDEVYDYWRDPSGLLHRLRQCTQGSPDMKGESLDAAALAAEHWVCTCVEHSERNYRGGEPS